jgi:hypothetical protein
MAAGSRSAKTNDRAIAVMSIEREETLIVGIGQAGLARARILLLAALATATPLVWAHAHSWYPAECCSGRDCMLADDVTTDTGGRRIVVVGDQRIVIPIGFTPKTSPDGRVHICFRAIDGELDNSTFLMPICLFVPTQS